MRTRSVVTLVSSEEAKRVSFRYGRHPGFLIGGKVDGWNRFVGGPDKFSYLVEGWKNLSPEEKQRRFDDVARIDWELTAYIQDLLSGNRGETTLPESQVKLITPKELAALQSFSPAEVARFRSEGETILREARFARMTLAAGEAARFKPDARTSKPKALFEIDDLDPTYLAIQALDIKEAQKRYGTSIPWIVFVHPKTRADFQKYLREGNYFGLSPEHIFFVEHTEEAPKFTEDGNLALDRDAVYKVDGVDVSGTGQDMLFSTTGHGFFATAYRHNPTYNVEGVNQNLTPYEVLQARGITHVFLSNIDNLGATVGTSNYAVILGFHYCQRSEGTVMTIELADPLTYTDTSGRLALWDQGGIGVSFNDKQDPAARFIVAEENMLPPKLEKAIKNPQAPYPFNTANATLNVDAIPERVSLPPTLQLRNRVWQYETNFWSISHTRSVPVAFLVVPRIVPKELLVSPLLPPAKGFEKDEGARAAHLAAMQEFNRTHQAFGEHWLPSRFIPTKYWDHRMWAAAQWRFLKRD